jgi:hypothetical protein
MASGELPEDIGLCWSFGGKNKNEKKIKERR